MNNQVSDGSDNAPSRHPAAQLLFQIFQFLCQRFGVSEDQLIEVQHLSNVPRTWQVIRLDNLPVEMAYSDPLPPSSEVELGNTWEKYAVLKIGSVGSIIENDDEANVFHDVVEILAGPYNTPIFKESVPANSWDIRPDPLNSLSRISVGTPHALVIYTALAGISTILLRAEKCGMDCALCEIDSNKLLGGG